MHPALAVLFEVDQHPRRPGTLASDEFTLKLSPDATNFFAALRGHKDLHGRLAIKDAGRSYPIRWRPRPGTTTIDVLGLGTSNTGTVAVAAPGIARVLGQRASPLFV
jgi:hypothetical protein